MFPVISVMDGILVHRMNSKYYREYYKLERAHWWFKAREEIIAAQVQKIAAGKTLQILNIGTATGRGSEMLARYGKVTSLEYDPDCVQFLREELKMEVDQGSVLALPYADNSFDLVCAFDVIEHVEEDQKAVSEIRRVCRQGGHIFCTVPAYNFLWSQHDDVNHHWRRYTAASFQKLFSECRIVFESYFNSILFPPIALFRLVSKIIPTRKLREGSGSDFSLKGSAVVNNLFYRIFSLENSLLKKRKKLPAGVSYLLIAEKSA